MGKYRLSIFDYISRCRVINYYVEDDPYPFRDFIIPLMPIAKYVLLRTSISSMRNGLIIAKTKYNMRKYTNSALSKMAKKDTPLKNAMHNSIEWHIRHW